MRKRGSAKVKESGIRNLCSAFCVLCSVFLFSPSAFAEEQTEIIADNLEYLSQSDTYIAKGSVKITFDDATLTADEMQFNGGTSDAVATGNVVFENPETVINADRIELNLKTKLGVIYNNNLFYKKRNLHIRGRNLKKTGEKNYYFEEASLTSCDAAEPAWHISGRDIETVQDQSLSARHTRLYVKNTPVLYMPYFWTPITKERQTGFLFPSFGYSSTKGHYYKQGFFWALKENQDATIYLDYYTEKKLAEGLDYRYVLNPDVNGEFWIYRARDNNPARDLLEIKSYHNLRLPYETSGYLKLHYVNNFDYYETLDSTSRGRFGMASGGANQLGFASDERLQKYLESDLLLSKPFNGGRTYFLAQTRQSLEGSSREIPQRLPEMGFVINTMSQGPLSFNSAIKGINFWRKDGQDGLRFDINPNLYLSYGRLINITQKAGLRETAYFFDTPSDNKSRHIFDLNTSLSTKFFRTYDSFIHIIEPAFEYSYIPPYDNDDIPFFDSTDSIPHTSSLSYSLTNRISGLKTLKLQSKFRLSQSYSFLDKEKPFSPVLAEAVVSGEKVDFYMNASYDVHERVMEETIASVFLKDKAGYVGLGKNFRRSSNLDQISFEAGLNSPIRISDKTIPVSVSEKLWYDLKGHGVQEFSLQSTYTHQCWGITVSFTKRPEEYQILVAFELKGLGTLALGGI